MASSIFPETVSVPVLGRRPQVAPAIDPHLRAGTVTTESVTVCGYTLPPIMSGIQPGLDLQGAPRDYSVKVIYASRQHVDAMLSAIGAEHEALAQALAVVRSYLCHLDGLRAETRLGINAALGWLKKDGDTSPQALGNLETVAKLLGGWDDEVRLHLAR